MYKITIQTLAYCISVVLITFQLHSCSGGSPSKPSGIDTQISEAQNLANTGQLRAAAKIYWELSKTQPSPDKELYQLQSAELLIESGDFTLAQEQLNVINSNNLNTEQLPRKHIAQAKISNQNRRYSEALSLLPESMIGYAPSYQIAILELRAQAYQGSGNTLAGLQTRIALDGVLNDPEAIQNNHNKIWQLLLQANEAELESWSNTDNRQQAGWIALAQAIRAPYANKDQLIYALDEWKYNYSNHPASEDFINTIADSYQNFFVIPDKIALLLPMSGRFAKISEVIYAGISSARTLNNEIQYNPELVLYDTGDNPADIEYYYDLAVSEGADFVIGPLKKEAVELLSKKSELPIPVLTLNYLTQGATTPSNMFQFGLLPEDEAQQVAERSSLDDNHRAIILAPIGEWGSRLVSAFDSRYSELNGVVIDTQYYSPAETDFSNPLKTALHLNQSEARYQQLRSLLGQNLEFEPRRRQDVDMIFLVATPRIARLMRPQINYYYATGVPVYSTSHVFSGVENIIQDRDLEGIIYLDIPWILSPSNKQELLAEFLELEAGDAYQILPRFAALGVDAYYLPLKLAELSSLPYERYDGLTGRLSIQEKNKIYRQLNWAVFKNGRPTVTPHYDLESQ